MRHSIRENFAREEPVTPVPTAHLAFVMAAALSILAMLNGWHGGRAWPWLTGGALLFLTAALLIRHFSIRLAERGRNSGCFCTMSQKSFVPQAISFVTSAEAGQFCHSAGTS